MKAQTYMLTSLNCPNCAAKLEKAVAAMEGVKEARVGFGTGTLNVQYDETKLGEKEIKDTIRRFNLDVTAVLPGRVK
ncbi:MAG: heavy-metal-associated domain-containing protein [Bacillota bacterium]